MAPIHLITNPSYDRERLVNNHSVNSFNSENNELTITRSLSDRKYSMMSFKPSDRNTIDIVITKGEYSNGREPLKIQNIGSQDIRRHYSIKAKFFVTTVIFLLLIMTFVLLFAMFNVPQQNYTEENSAVSENFSLYHSTELKAVTENVVAKHVVNATQKTNKIMEI